MYTARLVKEPNSKVSVQKKLHPFPTKRSQRTTPFIRQSGNWIEEINRWRTDNQTRKLSSRLIYKPRSNKSKKSVKKALDSKKLNYAIHKNENQMQSIDYLEDSVAVYISEEKNLTGKNFLWKIDLKNAKRITKHYFQPRKKTEATKHTKVY